MNAIPSAAGPANRMPSRPKNKGRMSTSGMRKMTCRVMESRSPFTGFPIAAKKLEEISCTPLNMTIKRKILINLTENSKYAASPVPNSEMI